MSTNARKVIYSALLLSVSITALLYFYDFMAILDMLVNDFITMDDVQTTMTKYYTPPKNNTINLPALVLIGVQKAGTTSMTRLLNQIPEVYALKHPRELHYFNKQCYQSGLTYDRAIRMFNQNCSLSDYQQLIIANVKEKHYDSFYISEKTPEYVYYPHIANIISNHLVTTGTKLLVILRDPITRFISGLFMTLHYQCNGDGPNNHCLPSAYLQTYVYGYDEYIANQTVDEIMNYNNDTKVQTFNRHLNMINWRFEYGLLPDDRYYTAIMALWKNFIYPEKHHKAIHKVWNRGCYGPQILWFLNELQQIGPSNSFKVIQYERLYDDQHFQNIMNLLRCYIHSNDKEAIGYGFANWMRNCIDGEISYVKKMHFEQYDTASDRNERDIIKNAIILKKKYESDEMELELLRRSYSACNKATKIVINDHYDELILENWDWNAWSG